MCSVAVWEIRMLLCAAWEYGKSGCYCVQLGNMGNQDVIVCSVGGMGNQDVIVCSVAVWDSRMLLCAAWQYGIAGCYCVQRGSMG